MFIDVIMTKEITRSFHSRKRICTPCDQNGFHAFVMRSTRGEQPLKIRSHILLLLALPLALGATPLPRSGPLPEAKPAEEGAPATPSKDGAPDTAAQEKPDQDKTGPEAQSGDEQPDPATEPEADIPTPEPKPATEGQPPSTPEKEAEKPAAGEEKPADETPEAGKSDGEENKEDEEAKTPPPPPPPPVEKEDPEALKACLADLVALGTKFKTATRIDDGEGCGIDQPLEVAEAIPGLDTGGAQMRCETARALGHWLKDTVQPALKIAMPGKTITGITTGSTYACRLRNSASTGKISEHARGNAIDVAAFKLNDGSEITMKPRNEDGTMEGAFQRTATAGACLHFSTVLSPGSDAAHQDHLHLDVIERDSGYRYCR
jgi:hypothetical protein